MNGLVLNLGLKGIRAIIFDRSGKIIAASHKKVHTYVNKDHVEQDPYEWWEKGLGCIKDVLKIENHVDFITVTASAACLVPIDRAGNPLMNVIMVSDKRAMKEAEDVSGLASFKNLNYKARAYCTIPRILWIKKNHPDMYDKTYKFLSPNDYLIYKMTNEAAIDTLNATKYYTVDNEYPHQLLDELSLDIKKLPAIVEIGHSLKTSDVFVQHTNLTSNVIISTYDAICAFFGSGVKSEGYCCDMSGTVTSLRVLTKNSLVKGETRLFELPYKDWRITGGSNNMGGDLIEWGLEVFYEKDKHLDLEELNKHFSSKSGLIFLPYLLGERAPYWDNNVRGAFLGLERFHDKHDMIRAILEATGFILRNLLDTLRENNIEINKLFCSGGLAKLDIVNQIKADILGIELHKLKETESTAFGAYCLAVESVDQDYDPSACIDIEKTFVPDMEKHEIYSRMYPLFKEGYLHLKDFHHKRQKYLETDDIKKVNI